MYELVTITDLTRMHEQRVCIAGYLANGACIRPILRFGQITEEWLKYSDQLVVRPFAQVEFDLIENRPQPPHTEDWIINPNYRINNGLLDKIDQKSILDKTRYSNVESIFETTIYRDEGPNAKSGYIKLGEGKRSLGTVKPQNICWISYTPKEEDKWDYRITFIDQSEREYRLAVTDLAFRCFLDLSRIDKKISPNSIARRLNHAFQRSEVYIRIGLARGWEKYPERCYLQITGIYSFPDYLCGHCFDDISCSIDEIIESL